MSDDPPWLYPIAIGVYDDAEFERLDVDADVARIGDILAEFGVAPEPWAVQDGDRDKREVDKRLRAWWESPDERDSILYWAGHGWADADSAALAHAESPFDVNTTGVLPVEISKAIERRERHGNRGAAWTMVIINACKSYQFARTVNSNIEQKPRNLSRYIILGVSGDGPTNLGVFASKLEQALRNVFGADDAVELVNLAVELKARLPGSYLHHELGRTYLYRPDQLAGLTLDVLPDLKAIIDALPEDERAHFLPKAQSAEIGELLWYFEGRDDETRAIVDWLTTATNGLLVVTGRAGSGKSALLGHVLTQSRPALRERLVAEVGLRRLPPELCPPDNVFSASLLLTGATAADLPARLATALGLAEFPADAALDQQIDWLRGRLADRTSDGAPVTVLIDALDEAAQPLPIVRRVLADIARLDRVRVIVGTRRSTKEGPDLGEPPDNDILDALTAEGATTVWLTYDPDAIDRYVRRRLDGSGVTLDTAADPVALIAAAVQAHRHEFLYARLVVHELIAAAGAGRPVPHDQLSNLLRSDYQSLFESAVGRLAALAPVNRALLVALALARGRGLPMQDRVWATAAQALELPDDLPGGVPIPVTADALDEILEHAAPYIMRDAEAGQTVYRLAHRTFAELLTAGLIAPHRGLVDALIAAAEPGRELNPYLTLHLADHAAEDLAAWRTIAGHPQVLDRLDPTSVTVHAVRYGLSRVPAPIAGIAVMRHRLLAAEPSDRPGLREIGMAKLGVPAGAARPGDTWRVQWAAVAQETRHLTFGRRHDDVVRALVAFRWADGRTVVASGGSDHTIRVWDTDQGTEIRTAWTDPDRAAIWSMAVLPPADDGVAIVYGGNDGVVRIWNPATNEIVSWFAHTGAVQCLAVLGTAADEPRIVSGGFDGAIRQWSTQGQQIGRDWAGDGPAQAQSLTVIERADGAARVISCGDDGGLRQWDPETGTQIGEPWTGHTGGSAWSAAAFTDAAGATRVVSGGEDGTLRLWDPGTGTPIGDGWTQVDVGAVHAVITVRDPYAGRPLVVAATSLGKLWLWDPATGQPMGRPWEGHTHDIRALAAVAVPGPDLMLVASAGDDRSVRLWEPIEQRHHRSETAGTGDTRALTGVRRPGAASLLAAGQTDGTVRVWDPQEAPQSPVAWAAHEDGVSAMTSFGTDDDRTVIVSSGADYTVRAWDPRSGQPIGPRIPGHRSPIRALVPLLEPGAPALVVSASGRTLRLWNPLTGEDVGEEWPGHLAYVGCLATVRDRAGRIKVVSGSLDRTIRLWNPADGRQIGKAWTGHGNEVTALASAPTDAADIVVSASKDRTLRWWDPATGEQIDEPLDVGAEIRFLRTATGRDGQPLLVGAAGDRTVRVWDVARRAEVARANVGYEIGALCVHDDDAVAIGTDEGVVAIALW